MRAHKANRVTNYMRKVVAEFAGQPVGLRLLDLPAGKCQVTDALRTFGHQVTPADIAPARDDCLQADMNQRLPFDDGQFDGVICLEGIEHVLDPFRTLGELIRVTRPGGRVIVSTPNVMSMYSRLQYLFTGTFFNFHPGQLEDVAPGEPRDRFHISPLSYHWLRYMADYFGARVVRLEGDKVKRKVLMPLYLPILLLGNIWSRRLFFDRRYEANRERNGVIYDQTNSWACLFSLTLVVVLEKDYPDGARDDSVLARRDKGHLAQACRNSQ